MQKAQTFLVVRADDIGSCQAANAACIDVYTQGICRSVELMAPCAWAVGAARLLVQHSSYDVGVHLTLTSEWDDVKWGPLTRASSLVGPDGYFCASFGRGTAGRPAFNDLEWKLDEVEAEFRAQIEWVCSRVRQTSHLSYHMGVNRADERIGGLCAALAAEYGLAVDLSGFARFRGFGEGSTGQSAEEKIRNLVQSLQTLAPGKWLFVDHPAYDTPETRAIGHLGYTHVAADRQGVTEAWTDASVLAMIAEKNIQLISYAAAKDL